MACSVSFGNITDSGGAYIWLASEYYSVGLAIKNRGNDSQPMRRHVTNFGKLLFTLTRMPLLPSNSLQAFYV